MFVSISTRARNSQKRGGMRRGANLWEDGCMGEPKPEGENGGYAPPTGIVHLEDNFSLKLSLNPKKKKNTAAQSEEGRNLKRFTDFDYVTGKTGGRVLEISIAKQFGCVGTESEDERLSQCDR